MDGDVGTTQEIVRLLASETGLSFVKEITDRHLPQLPILAGQRFWNTELRPFFRLISHALVVNSAILEQQVAIIYNFLYGVGGDRMTRCFSFVAQVLKSWRESSSDTSRDDLVELAFAVLSKLLDCNTSNMVNERFTAIAAELFGYLEGTPSSDGEFCRLQASKYLEYIRLRLDVGDEISISENRIQVSVAREQFLLRQDLPGTLSADGARHDNDSADITKIRILPTYEEIMSTRTEYLPTIDSSQWHINGIHGHLDREFRLLRSDAVGPLRDAIHEIMDIMQECSEAPHRRSKNGARTYLYDSPILQGIELDRIGGLELLLRCNQLSTVRNLSLKKREEWWANSNRLQSGALICVLDATGSATFYMVSDSTMRSAGDKNARRPKPSSQDDSDNETTSERDAFNLSSDANSLFVRLQLVDPSQQDVGQLIRSWPDARTPARRYLVEFPNLLLASFRDTLMALQQMFQKPDVPFSELIAPTDGSGGVSVKPPLYASKPGFLFSLKVLTHGNAELTVSPQEPPEPEEISSRSTLDPTQSAALINTLTRGLSLIQGPPGTGKSYTGEKIIKVLLENKDDADLGHILCVCCTNHALDQLLEHLLEDGTKNIIRIGSRSKSERLQDLNLRTIARKSGQGWTWSEKVELRNAEASIRENVNEVASLFEQYSRCSSWQTVKEYLATHHPNHSSELFPSDHDGWQTVTHQKRDTIDQWLRGGHRGPTGCRSVDTLNDVPLFSMANIERQLLHSHWLENISDNLLSGISICHENFVKARVQRDRLHREGDLRCLQQAHVVGVTTTGLTKNIELVRGLAPKVVLCEESGEVLEGHTLTALLPSVEHAILIGDHLQLRPQIQNYGLQSSNPQGKQYSLDMSLFERLVEPPSATDLRMPFSILETQRRMHPSVSELIRSTLYPTLKDGDKVLQYPEVVGMKRRLFWFHHENPEAGTKDQESTSHENEFEACMTVALVSH